MGGASEFRYCNEFLFKADAPLTRTSALSSWAPWATLRAACGCLPRLQDPCALHTPHLVLEHMLQLGQIYEVFIHNMEMEAHDRTAKIHEDRERPLSPREGPSGFVAVAAGSGARQTSSSLSASTWIVSGWSDHEPLDCRPAGRG